MKRSALAAVGTLAVLALSACTGGSAATPAPAPASPTPLPTSTVTPSVSPSPAVSGTTTTPRAPRRTTAPATPRATPTSSAEISGAIGTVPAGFTLPEEGRPADGEVGAFTTTVWRASCPDRLITLSSASGVTATRVKESVGPERVVGNGLLVFRDAAAATAFADELTASLAQCASVGPDDQGWRTMQASGALAGFGEQGVQVSQWSQWHSGGSWSDAPGASLQYLARKGPSIVLTYEGGEYVGDPAGIEQVRAEAGARLSQMLAQL